MCIFEACSRLADTKGLCQAHYQQQWRGQELRPLQNAKGTVKCSFAGCTKLAKSGGLCNGHIKQKSRGTVLKPLNPTLAANSPNFKALSQSNKVCSVFECFKPVMGKGFLCRTDHNRMTKFSLSVLQYLALPDSCESCGDTWRLSIDHDHSCCPGKGSCGLCVRGVLCSRCNTALAFLQDSPSKIKHLLDYIQTHN